MDKRVIFAVAGSGKTTELVNQIEKGERCVVFTYTEENVLNLRRKISERFGFVPESVQVMTYFSFLHSYCYRPAAGLSSLSSRLSYDQPGRSRFNASQDGYYKDAGGRLYHSRLAKYVLHKGYMPYVRERISRFSDRLLVDEVQDFSSHDFDFLLELAASNVEVLMVGDFHQHTYDTSRDGSKGSALHSSFGSYKKRFVDVGVAVDTVSLSKSRRCSSAVCEFITSKLGISIESASARVASVRVVDSQSEADEVWSRPDVVKLFYQEHSKYDCFAQNWGGSKGEDHYDEICVVLNKTTWDHYQNGSLASMSPLTLNKLYVALSRSRGDVSLVRHTYFDSRKGQSRSR